jgi:hypothetical protein
MNEEEKIEIEQECLLKYSKAQMINKYIDELEEKSKLSKLLCKSQQENEELKKCYCNRTDCSGRIKDSKKYDSLQDRIDKAIKYIESNPKVYVDENIIDVNDIVDWEEKVSKYLEEGDECKTEFITKLLQILKGSYE